ncbi:uncharacterized protein BCR38DRAFT_148401 [Pseudomassariella vexata]|uniref:Secreted protein n=1 Tax=Pseudomassariella vexata TaxID=1141098 RepID=A0A1Y2D667_9PEZI|nr:uncharacterized protein BCR38DRAFT_148401 [Pseudomassariella vexata]ORY54586.1 hypothetical protein BCR38DRAFT_148401 [Pseudomassariella vexata]
MRCLSRLETLSMALALLINPRSGASTFENGIILCEEHYNMRCASHCFLTSRSLPTCCAITKYNLSSWKPRIS